MIFKIHVFFFFLFWKHTRKTPVNFQGSNPLKSTVHKFMTHLHLHETQRRLKHPYISNVSQIRVELKQKRPPRPGWVTPSVSTKEVSGSGGDTRRRPEAQIKHRSAAASWASLIRPERAGRTPRHPARTSPGVLGVHGRYLDFPQEVPVLAARPPQSLSLLRDPQGKQTNKEREGKAGTDQCPIPRGGRA